MRLGTMWSSRLFWKLVIIYGGLNLLIAATFPLALSRSEEERIIGRVRERLHGIALLTRDRVQRELVEERRGGLQTQVRKVAALTDVRVTVVAADGVVLADSDAPAEKMQNHSNREEFLEAEQRGLGDAIRRSATLGIPFLYFALPVKNEREDVVAYVRVAEQVQTIKQSTQASMRRMWLLAFGVALLAAPITYVVAGRIVRPLAELTAVAKEVADGKYRQSISVGGRDEVGDLARAFSRMAKELTRRMAQLEDQNQRMSTVLSGMEEGVLAVDSDRRILVANEACARLLGIEYEDFVGRPFLEVARNADIDAAINETLSSGETASKEISFTSPQRRVVGLFATALPMEPERGAVVVLHDVTELRRLENLRRDFVANVSHELKTPLASIQAYSETLKLGAIDDPENNLRFVQRILDQATLLNQLITDLLQLARVETGKEAFQFESIDLGACVRDQVNDVEQLARQKDIHLQMDGEDGVTAWADRRGVETIITNLLGNAIKYTPAAGQVTVRWRSTGDSAILEIADTGIGIAPEDQQRVFERFFRVDKARSRAMGGTGLGLSIVKHLCQAFGGAVQLQSQLQQGSTFRVILPASDKS